MKIVDCFPPRPVCVPMQDKTCLKCGLPLEVGGCMVMNEVGALIQTVNARCRYCSYKVGFSIALPIKELW